MSEARRPKQHWIPAVVLAGFSADVDRPRPRDKRLQVRYRNRPKAQVVAAKNLAYERGLYDWDQAGPFEGMSLDTLDDTFNPYERRIPEAIAATAESAGHAPLELWLRALVPYVAGLAVRGPLFLADARAEPDHGILIQSSRWMEMSRSLAPLMAADWYAIIAPANSAFLINDRGYAWTYQEDLERNISRVGLLVPLASGLCLAVLPTPERVFANQLGDEWIASLPTRACSEDEVDDINVAIAQDAVEWIAGSTTEAVEQATFGEPDLSTPPLGYSWPDRGGLGAHDQDWPTAMRLAGFLMSPDDWQPVAILSSIEPGVRLVDLKGHAALEISFVRPQDQGLIPGQPE
jgi:hypothetical protein